MGNDAVTLIVKMAMDAKKYTDGLTQSTASTKSWAAGLGGAVTAGVAVAIAAVALLVGAIAGIGVASFAFANETSNAMNMFQAQTGAATAEMEGFKNTALDIFESNWGDSITDVAESMATVKQVTGATGEELEDLTRKALIMRDVFGKDVQESIRAVDTAVETFGITGSQTFDLITTTIQRVGDPADDLLDTVNEYAPIFAQAGFSAEQMFGILEAGLEAGARNFDVVADAVKEFQIRIVDGSTQTEDALNSLFIQVGEGNQELVDLKQRLADTKAGLEANKAALEEAEGAYAASKSVVDELGRALSDAKRELDNLSRPNLAGMQAYDDQLFEIEQQSKQVKLAMLDMIPESDAYKAAQEQLDGINKQMDKVSLERDLAFDRQLREIEKAAKEGTETVLTYDEAMSRIGAKKSEIAGLESAFASANTEMEANKAQVDQLTEAQDYYVKTIENIENAIADANNPAQEFLKGFEDGSLTGADAMSQIIQKLKLVDDEVARNQIGVALFGTKWEDLGPDVILALDPAIAQLEAVENATLAAGDAASKGLGASWETIKRRALVALEPLGQKLLELADKAMPYVEQAFGWFEEKLPPLIENAGLLFDWLAGTIETYVVPFIQGTLIPAFRTFGDWLINEGWPAFQAFITPVIEQVVPGLMLLGQIVVSIATAAWPILAAAIQWVGDNFNIIMPILAAVAIAIAVIESPILLVIGAIVLLATAWANNWGGIQEKTQTVLDFIMPFIAGAMAFISSTVSSVLSYLQGWWQQHGDSIMTIAQAAWDFILKIIDTDLKLIWVIIQTALAIIQVFWDEWGQTIITLAQLTWDSITVIVQAGMDLIGYIIDLVAAAIRGDWEGFGEALRSAWDTVWTAIGTILDNAKTGLETVIANLITLIQGKWDDFVLYLDTAWQNLWDAIALVVSNVASSLMDYLQPVKDFIDDILDLIDDVMEAINSLPDLGSLTSFPTNFTASGNTAVSGQGNNGSIITNNFTQNNFMSGTSFDPLGNFQAQQAFLTT